MNCINNGTMAAMAAALAANSTMSSDKTQMRLYLDRLKAMVPQCPKNRKVSRQELIEHVINYISDLEDTLQSDSDSEADSPPASPTTDFSFSDSFNQYAQYGGYDQQSQLSGYTQDSHLSGYSQQPQFGDSFKQQPSTVVMERNLTSTPSSSTAKKIPWMDESHGSSDYSKYYGKQFCQLLTRPLDPKHGDGHFTLGHVSVVKWPVEARMVMTSVLYNADGQCIV
nr:uncharacterized protein LOC113814684 [Penaeus vannamei]